MWRGIAALAVLLAASPAGADDVMHLDRTEPSHLRAPFRSVVPPERLQPRTRFIRSQAVYSFPEALENFARLDKRLTHLCQRGAFIQESDGFYWARTPDKRYGVAFSGGANLVDAQNQRKPGTVYFFEGQDSRCTVYSGSQPALMKHYIGK